MRHFLIVTANVRAGVGCCLPVRLLQEPMFHEKSERTFHDFWVYSLELGTTYHQQRVPSVPPRRVSLRARDVPTNSYRLDDWLLRPGQPVQLGGDPAPDDLNAALVEAQGT